MSNKSNSVLASIGRGIKQSARWVAKMFGYKAENKYARGVWYVFATSAAIFALIFVTILVFDVVDLVKDLCEDAKYERMVNSPTYLHDYCNQYVSPYVIYHDDFPGYLYNTTLGQRTATGVQWICKSSDGDSLACFCTVTALQERLPSLLNTTRLGSFLKGWPVCWTRVCSTLLTTKDKP